MALKKELMKGWLELAVLSVLRSGEDHGYQLLSRLRKAGGPDLCPRPGNLYPILHRLEDRGWVSSRAERTGRRRRRVYRLTSKGRRALREETDRWGRMVGCLQTLRRRGPAKSKKRQTRQKHR